MRCWLAVASSLECYLVVDALHGVGQIACTQLHQWALLHKAMNGTTLQQLRRSRCPEAPLRQIQQHVNKSVMA